MLTYLVKTKALRPKHKRYPPSYKPVVEELKNLIFLTKKNCSVAHKKIKVQLFSLFFFFVTYFILGLNSYAYINCLMSYA